MRAVVPAAGEGSRLRPLTADRPKPLVEVGGRPLLSHCFDALLDCAVSRFVVVVGYRAEAVVARYGHRYAGVPITYVRQRDPRGLADAVLAAAPHLADDFVVLNADNVHRSNLAEAVDRHRSTDATATLLVEPVDRDSARKTGVVEVADDGRVTGVTERPTDPDSTLVNAGFVVLGPAALDACRLLTPSGRGEYELAAAIDLLRAAGHRIEAVPLEGWRVNVNTPADLAAVERRLD